MKYQFHYHSPLGPVTMESDGTALTGLWFDGQKHFGAGKRNDVEIKKLPLFQQTQRWLDTYFQGHNPGVLPPLAPNGTDFQKEVWALLNTIPYGQTASYKEIGAKLAQKQGRPSMSAQAIGGAVGHNPISLLIPCHRVIGADGSLTGYAGGLERKRALLMLETGQRCFF